MNKHRIIQITAAAFLLAGTVSAGLSFAWFHPTTKIGDKGETNAMPIDGSTSSAYFAYGDGSAEKPYGIKSPRHLYNLAWLQYINHFQNKQLYFELAGNVDMSGWTLPPIGTEDHPFISQFNGQGYVVSNLTVSNDFADYNVHPSAVQEFNTTNYKQPHILGMFGVVGNYNGDVTDYSSAVNTLTDTGIYNATIKTSVSDSLIGIAAGYVDADLANVVVDSSTINVASSSSTAYKTNLTSNISDYSLVGYTTKETSIRQDEESVYDINVSTAEFNASQGDEQGWGGSINIKAIHERLYGIRSYATATESFAWRTRREYFDDSLSSTNNSTVNYFKRYHGYNTTNHEYLGNYSFIEYATSNTVVNYIAGGHEEINAYYTYYKHSGHPITDGSGNYLNFDGTNLVNGTNANTCTLWTFTQSSGSNYYISTFYDGTEYRLYNYNETLAISSYNLTDSSRIWSISEDGNNLIISSDDEVKIYYYEDLWQLIPLTDSTSTYYVIRSANGGSYNYISAASTSGYTPTNTTNQDSAAKFNVDSSGRFYFVNSSGQTLYLAYYRSQGGGTTALRLINSTNANRYYYFNYNGTTLTAIRNGTVYYVRYNNGWTYTNDSSYAISPYTMSQQIDYSSYSLNNTFNDEIIENRAGPDYYQTSNDINKTANNSHMYYDYNDTTYFPLNVNEDGGTYNSRNALNTAINNGNFDPKDTNTGYIVGGSDYTNLGQNVTLDQSDNRNDISKLRISSYPISYINQSFTTGTNITLDNSLPNSKVYTFNTSGTDRTMSQEYSQNAYPKYYESRQSFFENALTTSTTSGTTTRYSSNSNVYGLHFMNTTINTKSIVNASKISILGNKCDKYELPANSIDFNLKQKGSVNFFAGTYFTGNNSFFSLYQIVRNSDAVSKTNGTGEAIEGEYTSFNTINDIKEIVAVYSNDVGTKTTKYSNIYKYKNVSPTGSVTYTYSEPYRFDGNQNRFKMNKNNTTDNDTPYSDNYMMSESDFNAYKTTYGYTLRLDSPNQLGYRSGGYTSNRIYYFEFPMNAGEYCLGSVDGATGAYLLYLDIGANAAKTQRTIFYEHFTITEKAFSYPLGIALQELTQPTAQQSAMAIITTDIDAADSVCVEIVPGSTGTILVDRVSNSVALTRAQSMNAPPIYAGSTIESVYDTSAPSTPLTIVGEEKTTDVKRMQYYDFNVNLDTLTITTFTDTLEDGESEYVRTIKQSHYSTHVQEGDPTTEYVYDASTSTDQRTDMVVYNTNGGTRYTEEDLINQTTLPIGDASSNVALTIQLNLSGADVSYTNEINLFAVVDTENIEGTYYLFDNYVIELVPTGSSIIVKVLAIDESGNVDEIYLGETELTTVNQTITVEIP